ncbi:hypothetical protein BDV37DRAFT_67754 [Aspergillus pseudonomiae]|uniref:Uncharacterized protein n=1 Tax=Aspergillus pseudonomiae TaxID=1506151 RepID=A0A5N7DI45_9EURO|nr:uncharacterized protein BDV37DRAFT_67754 [Aspergillus pseudonomiae]KAE8406132.1 hypothetical protein BDV37DRAFT_67754 [Aspergillus pseudonomiae]
MNGDLSRSDQQRIQGERRVRSNARYQIGSEGEEKRATRFSNEQETREERDKGGLEGREQKRAAQPSIRRERSNRVWMGAGRRMKQRRAA